MNSISRKHSRTEIAISLISFCTLSALIAAYISPADYISSIPGRLLLLVRTPILVALATILLWREGRSWSDVGAAAPGWRKMLIWVPLGYLLLVVAALLAKLIMQLAGLAGPDYSAFSQLKGNLSLYLFWALPTVWISAALGEEFAFRGYVRDALARIFGREGGLVMLLSILAQAVIFGLLHIYLGFGGMVIATAAGLALGAVWFCSGRNLWAGVVVHGLIDLGSMTAIYFGATG